MKTRKQALRIEQLERRILLSVASILDNQIFYSKTVQKQGVQLSTPPESRAPPQWWSRSVAHISTPFLEMLWPTTVIKVHVMI